MLGIASLRHTPTGFSRLPSPSRRAGHARMDRAVAATAARAIREASLEQLEPRLLLAGDIAISGFRADGQNLLVDYSIVDQGVNAFDIGVYRSVNGTTPGPQLLSQRVTDSSALAIGAHTATLPASFADVAEDYYLLAKVDAAGEVAEANEANNTMKFAGGVFRDSGGRVHVHGTDAADVVSVDVGTLLTVAMNGTTYTFPVLPVLSVNARLQGGNDQLTGGAAVTWQMLAYGGAGNDTLIGGSGMDRLNGGAGNDLLQGQGADDVLNGGPGADRLEGGAGDDILQYSADGTWPSGWSARNTDTNWLVSIKGYNRSHDLFLGGDGYDQVVLTAGKDALFLDDSYSPVYGGSAAVARLQGIEQIDGRDGNDVIDLTSKRFTADDIFLRGGTGNDELWGSAGADWAMGDAGNDRLSGGAGNDVLSDALGTNKLVGGAGENTLTTTPATPSLVEPSGQKFTAYEVHGRFGDNLWVGDWEVGLTDNTNQPPEDQDNYAWANGTAVPFTLAVTANHYATFTLGDVTVENDYSALTDMDLSAVFIWAKASKPGNGLTIGNLVLDDVAVPGTISVSNAGTVFSERWVVGGDMLDGFTLTGDVTMTWDTQNPTNKPLHSNLQFHIQPGRTPEWDLDIDSNNDGVISESDSQGTQPAEDEIEEDAPGKVIVVNDDDSDDDGLVDYYDYDPTDGDAEASTEQFVPLVITVPVEVNPDAAKLRFTYSQSVPPVAPDPEAPLPDTGHLGIWRADGSAVRNPESISVEGSGDFVESGAAYGTTELNYDSQSRTIQLWVEGVSVDHATSHEIILEVDPSGSGVFLPGDVVDVTTVNTELYQVVDGELAKTDEMAVSHPNPVFSGVNVSVGGLRAGEDGVSIVGDISIQGMLDDAAMDLAEGLAGRITAIGVFLNGSTEASCEVPLFSWKASDPDINSLTKPYDFHATFQDFLSDAPLEPGTNFITLRAMNTYGLTGFYEQAFEVVVQEPETLPVEIRIAGLGTSELLLEYRRSETAEWGATLAFISDDPEHLVYRDGDGNAAVTVTQAPEYDGETGQLLVPARAIVAVSSIGAFADPVEFGSVDGEYLAGGAVATMNEDSLAELTTYDGFTFSGTMDSTYRASLGGEFEPFFVALQNSRHDPNVLPITDAEFQGSMYAPVQYDGKWFIGTEGFVAPRPFLAVLGRMPAQTQAPLPMASEGESLTAGVVEGTGIGLTGGGAPQALASGETGTFMEGFGEGLLDTGGDLVDGLEAAGKGVWYVVKNYNLVSSYWRLFTTGSSLTVQDQQRALVVSKVAQTLAGAVERIVTDDVRLIHAAFVGDDATVNEISSTYREVFELGIDLLRDVYTLVHNEVAGMTTYDAGKIVGRVAGEVLLQVLPAVLTAGASAAVTIPAKVLQVAGIASNLSKVTYITKYANLLSNLMTRVTNFAQYLSDAANLAQTLVELMDLGTGGPAVAAAGAEGGYDVLASGQPVAVDSPSDGTALPVKTSFTVTAAAAAPVRAAANMFRLIERWAFVITRIKAANPAATTKTLYTKVMQDTAAVSKDMDGCLGGVTRYFNKRMWKEAADAGGDYTKVPTHADLSALGIGTYAPGAKVGRFAQHEMWKHHAAVQAWAKEYLRAANPTKYGSWVNTDARWLPVMDGMPAIALPMRQHTRAGGAAFHSILPHSPGDVKGLPTDPSERADAILKALQDAYSTWDEKLYPAEKGLGSNVSAVITRWLGDTAQ